MSLFTYLRGLFSYDLLIELSEKHLVIKAFGSDVQYSDEPYIAIETIKGNDIIKDIGASAKNLVGSDIKVSNPFQHARSFVSDFFLAEKVIQHGIQTIHKGSFRAAPRVIIHQLEKTEGGLTSIEERVLRELAVGAGAREVLIYLGERINTDIDDIDTIKNRINSK